MTSQTPKTLADCTEIERRAVLAFRRLPEAEQDAALERLRQLAERPASRGAG